MFLGKITVFQLQPVVSGMPGFVLGQREGVKFPLAEQAAASLLHEVCCLLVTRTHSSRSKTPALWPRLSREHQTEISFWAVKIQTCTFLLSMMPISSKGEVLCDVLLAALGRAACLPLPGDRSRHEAGAPGHK